MQPTKNIRFVGGPLDGQVRKSDTLHIAEFGIIYAVFIDTKPLPGLEPRTGQGTGERTAVYRLMAEGAAEFQRVLD